MIRKRKNDGIALILVLAFTTAICTLVIFFQSKSKDYINFFAGAKQDMLLENIAEMGIEIGKEIIRVDRTNTAIINQQENPSITEKEFEIEGIHLLVKIEDENAKINPNKIFGRKGEVNTLLLEIFKRFFTVAGYPETMSASILDWIDEDGLTRPGGAESFYYSNSGTPYTPPNRNLYTREEILLIKDFNNKIVFGDPENGIKGLTDFLTSFSDGKINVNTCPPEILGALGFTTAEIDKIIMERVNRPIEMGFITQVNKEVYLKNKRVIVFKSRYFLIEASAVDSRGRQKQVRGYIEQKDKNMNTVRMEVR